jgi:hypothetical protein
MSSPHGEVCREERRPGRGYVVTAEPGHEVDVRLAGIAGDQFMAQTQTATLVGKTSDLPQRRPDRGEEITLMPSEWGGATGRAR